MMSFSNEVIKILLIDIIKRLLQMSDKRNVSYQKIRYNGRI